MDFLLLTAQEGADETERLLIQYLAMLEKLYYQALIQELRDRLQNCESSKATQEKEEIATRMADATKALATTKELSANLSHSLATTETALATLGDSSITKDKAIDKTMVMMEDVCKILKDANMAKTFDECVKRIGEIVIYSTDTTGATGLYLLKKGATGTEVDFEAPFGLWLRVRREEIDVHDGKVALADTIFLKEGYSTQYNNRVDVARKKVNDSRATRGDPPLVWT